MAKIIEWQSTPTYSIPLDIAMLCVNCNTISNSLPHRCSVCGSQSVLRLLMILDPQPDPPAAGRALLSLAYTRAVSA
jgi:hypothetical protein